MKARICPVCGGKVATTRDDCMHCGYVFHSADSRQYEEKPSKETKTTVIICPQCNSTDIEILSDGHGKCAYCGATLLLPKNDDDTKGGGTIFGILEDVLGDLSDSLQNASADFDIDNTPIITEEGAKHGKKVLAIFLSLFFVVIAVILAVVLPITLGLGGDTTPDEPTKPVYCVVHKYTNDCDTICNLCGKTRTVLGHVYDNACDNVCNVCKEKGPAFPHVYTNDCDNTCNVCGYKISTRSHDDENNDGICDTCQDPFALQYLTFTLNSDGESYTLTDVSDNLKCDFDNYVSEEISIPSTYNGKPVTAIGSYAFSNTGDFMTVIVPASITTLHANAFKDTNVWGVEFEDSSDWYLVEKGQWLSDASRWLQPVKITTLVNLYSEFTWTKTSN